MTVALIFWSEPQVFTDSWVELASTITLIAFVLGAYRHLECHERLRPARTLPRGRYERCHVHHPDVPTDGVITQVTSTRSRRPHPRRAPPPARAPGRRGRREPFGELGRRGLELIGAPARRVAAAACVSCAHSTRYPFRAGRRRLYHRAQAVTGDARDGPQQHGSTDILSRAGIRRELDRNR